MIRTQQTARPYAVLKNKDIVVLNGLQEINAGILEGSSEDEGIGRLGYALAPVAWSLGLRFVRIPGSEDGNEFDARVDAALEQIENEGHSDDPVVFSHGATIMFWTMMNVDNPDPTLLLTHQLDNTETVVVEKNDDGSWTLKSWGGEDVGPATLPVQLFVNARDLIVAPQTAVYSMRQPVLALDPQGIAESGAQAVEDVAKATVKFAHRHGHRHRQRGQGPRLRRAEHRTGGQTHREGQRRNRSHRGQQGGPRQSGRRSRLEEQRARHRGREGCAQRDLGIHQEGRRCRQEGRRRREGCGVFDRQQGRGLT